VPSRRPAKPAEKSGGDDKTFWGETHDRPSQIPGICDFWTSRRGRGRCCDHPPATAARSLGADRPVEFIVPAGTGGGADQMARVIQGIVTKHS
jgi:hypothetical protein